MGTYAIIKKEFKFLENEYGFEISMKQKRGSYYYINYINKVVNIKVLYDELSKEPLTIFVYDVDSLGFDAVEYKNEFEQKNINPRDIIRCAAMWLKRAIADNTIII